jgi:hypothetical protein
MIAVKKHPRGRKIHCEKLKIIFTAVMAPKKMIDCMAYKQIN